MNGALAGLGLCPLALLACKQEKSGDTSTEPAAPASATQAEPEPAPQASVRTADETPAEGSQPSTRPLSDDEIATLKKSMAGGTEVIKQQSFLTEFKDIGECSFISAMAPNKHEFVFFLFRNGKVYQGLLTYEKLKNWVLGTVTAVAFKDVDGDGFKDIVAIGEYMPGVGQAGKQKTPAAIVFMRKGANFKLDVARSEKASAAGNDVVRAAQLAR